MRAQNCTELQASNRLCKSSPNLLCDNGEKEARKRKSGACRRPEPSAAESAAQSPPGRAAHTPNGACALSAFTPLAFSEVARRDVFRRKNTPLTHPPQQPERSLGTDQRSPRSASGETSGGYYPADCSHKFRRVGHGPPYRMAGLALGSGAFACL